MPTAVQGDLFVHTCQYCGYPQTERRDKLLPFSFNAYRCSSCGRPLDDLDHDLLTLKSTPKRTTP
jgi:predicted SprT family Zn-dependent metalloprotease